MFLKNKSFLFTFIFVSVFASFLAFGKENKLIDNTWKTIHTKHFKIIIHSTHIDQAGLIAKESERALNQLRSVYSEVPKKILLLVDHTTNSPNGSATHFPYPHIVIKPALPTTYSSIGEYNEWVYELVLHELAHFLTFSPVHGLYRPLKFIFGNYFAPNFILLPTWFHEGLAVALETHLTDGGRLRSENYKEQYRALSYRLTSGHESLSRINERFIPSFPYGQRPYFYGGILLNSSFQNIKPKNFDNLVQAYSRAFPPYNIKSGAKTNVGRSFIKVRKTLSSAPPPADESTFEFLGHSPQWVSDKEFFTQHQDRDLTQIIYRYQIGDKTNKPKKIFSSPGLGRFVVFSKGKKILYDRMAPFKKNFSYSELFIYDIEKKKNKRLSFGGQIREAHISPHEKLIAAVKITLSRTSLVLLQNKKNAPIKLLYSPSNPEARISSIFFIDNHQISFLEKQPGKVAQAYILNLKSQILKKINLGNLKKVFWLEPYEKNFLVHANQEGKTRQFYISNDKLQPEQITFDPVGLRSASLFKNQVLISRITSKDYKTKFIQNYKETPKEATPQNLIQLSESFIKSSNTSVSDPGSVRAYSPWAYMVPQYWIPFYTPNYGGFSEHQAFTLSTGSTDPLNNHTYNLLLQQDSISNRLSAQFSYLNRESLMHWGFAASQFEAPLTSSLSRTNQSLSVSTRYDFGHDRSFGHSLEFRAQHNDTELGNRNFKFAGPSLRYFYNNVSQLPSRVAPDSGLFTQLNFSHFIDKEDYFSYNLTEFYFETFLSKYVALPQTSWKLFGKAFYSDQILDRIIAPINRSGYFISSRFQPDFVIRGYPTGIFQANESAYTLGLEYHFPLLNIYRGIENLPLFFRRIYGTLVADYGAFKGRLFSLTSNNFIDNDLTNHYLGAGLELNLDVTFGHYVPIKFSLGMYSPIEKLDSANTAQVFINLSTPAIP